MATAAPWTFVPPTPSLPAWRHAASIPVNNISLWYAEYGAPLHKSHSPPVILLHGGHISSRWWSEQIKFLVKLPYTTIAVDTRGHGRSTDDLSVPLTYDTFALDIIALLDFLKIEKASILGWSDGAVTALNLAMKYPSRVDRIFAFGANKSPSDVNEDGLLDSTTFSDVYARLKPEYDEINPTPNYQTFNTRVGAMQAKEPNWSGNDFASIPTKANGDEWPLVWIVDGDREEVVKRQATLQMFDWIPDSALVFLPHTSHFAPLQDVEGFNIVLKRFLEFQKW